METGMVSLKRGACLVDFCRRDCPVLPDDAHVYRADGGRLCGCGLALDVHPTFAYPTGMKHVVRDCDGRYWHL